MLEIDRIFSLAKEQGIKKQYLCSKIGVNEAYFRQAKNKEYLPEDIIEKAAEILDTTPDYIHGKTDKKEKLNVPVELSEKEKRLLGIIRSLPAEELDRLEAIAEGLLRLK